MDHMLQTDAQINYCRTCAGVNAIFPLFPSEGEENNLRLIIERYLPIKVSETDDLPLKVCEECARTLSAWNTLADGVTTSESRLKELLALHKSDDAIETAGLFSSEEESDEDDLPLVKIATPTRKKKERTKKSTTNSKAENKRSRQACLTRNLSVPNKRKNSKKELCPMCLKFVRNVESHLSQHRLSEDVRTKFCIICGEEQNGIETLSHHLYQHMDHVSYETYASSSQCRICESEFIDADALSRHLILHVKTIDQDKTFHCVACGKGCPRQNLARHLVTHSGDKRFTCHLCGNQYAQVSGLIRHVRVTHEGQRRYKCPICSDVFHSMEELRGHQETHPDPRPFQCDECGRTFQSHKQLYHHNKYHHTENGLRVGCPQCDRVFSSASVFRRHHKAVHLRLKQFQCDICSVQLSTKQYLQDHLRTHTDERSEVCKVCGKTFQMVGNLRQHMKTHMERLQVCDICGKRFTRKCQLAIHMGSHRDLAPQDCNHCGQSFLLKADLQKHVAAVHCI